MRFANFLTSLLVASPVLARRSLQHVGKGNKDVAYGRKLDARQAAPRGYDKRQSNGTSKYLTSKTEKFAVNGSGIPDVDFDLGESYAGNLPISDDPDEDSSLFFWFFPSTNEQADKEILIWLNGGPGCSSLEGLSQENGPFLWQVGTFKPILNPWSWHHLTNMIWIEQPVGTGFSTGTVTATSEEDVAKQFMGFWKNFIDTFEMQGYKVYISGESYAGNYCPYIASGMVDANDTTYYDMSGMLIYDPVINNNVMTEVIPTVAFTDYWAGLFPFNDTFKEYIHKQNEKCGFAQFLDKYLVYPPAGPMPVELPSQVGQWNNAWVTDECDLFDQVINATLLLNPCWDIYQVATTCPMMWDILGFPGTFDYIPAGADIYFNRDDVKKAINAPLDVDWAECAAENVFVNGSDTSAPSSFHAIPNVIEHTNNVIIGHGALDMVLIANGTLLAIQNMTWNGKMGFHQKPVEPFFVPYHRYTPYDTVGEANMGALAAAGVFGTAHTERGLTYVGVDIAGHMSPGYAPSAAYRVVEFMLGRVKSVNGNEPFTFAPDIPQPPVSEFGKGTAPQGWSDANTGHYQTATSAKIRGVGSARFTDNMRRKLKAM